LEPAKVKDSLGFGGDFELDLQAGQLRRLGRACKIERIPMEVLLLLVQRRGELVSREQIVERVWGRDVYLDTDNAINGAIRKIRQVLKDDPEQPRFIQTITGKGYRFIAAVTAPGAELESERPVVASQAPGDDDSARRFPRPRGWALGALLLAVAIVAIAAGTLYLRSSRLQAPSLHPGGRTMLAVLPFENLTGDATQEYFSDGMTEEMIAQLGSLDPDQMGVIARTTVMRYKHSQEQLRQIARELGVQYVLEGSVRRDAGRVRITAQLIQIKDQTHLWAQQYDRDPKDLLVVQSEIARQISDEIQTALGEHKPLAAVLPQTLSPQSLEAYNLYLKGQYYLNKRTGEGFQQATDYFQEATGKDPNFARAYAGLADCYALTGAYSGAPSAEFAPQARAAARRALQLDDSVPEAHAALALVVQNYDYDWQTAEREFKRAIELNPSYATGHHWYAEHLAWRGRFDEALRESERARQLDPLSLIIATDNAAIFYYSRQYDRALAQFNAVREMDPGFPHASLIFQVYVQKRMFAEATAEIEKRVPNNSIWSLSNLAYAYGRAGQQEEALQELRGLLALNQQQPMDPMVIVPAYIGTGNHDAAIQWLEKAYAQHSNGLTRIKVDPVYDPLRGDPRFQDLLKRIGLAH
jgi:TolB-like protein/DNA-binding winged helix-turn-helix (wHTH) protein/Tfp pilus assembly protein PilF